MPHHLIHTKKHYLALKIRQVRLGLKQVIVRFFLRQRDKRYSTYEELNVKGALGNYFTPPDTNLLQPLANCLATVSNEFVMHNFDVLGSGWVHVKHRALRKDLGEIESFIVPVNNANCRVSRQVLALIDQNYRLIDWQLDFKSGYRWSESTWYQDIIHGHKAGVDIKVPWELARMHHLTQLAFQYQIAGKEGKYLREFRNQILDFIALNPPRFGVNWRCTMDVAIRVSNWLVAYDLFCNYGAEFDKEFLKVFKRSIYEHGKHIINNLEWYPHLRSNHYLANIVGLLFVAAYLPKSKDAESWLNFSTNELIKEVKSQFNSDGSNFEASTSYHRLSGEMVIYVTLLILSLPDYDVDFPHWYIERIQKIAEFTIDITRPDGLVPQIGDNDNGRFLKLFSAYKKEGSNWVEELQDHRHLVAAISTLFDNEEFRTFAGTGAVETNLLEPKQIYEAKKSSHRNKYPDFGAFIFKTERAHMVVRCGSIGQNGYGGHAHNDQLSFELCIDGVPIIVDPGTYVYTPFPEQRNAFRSTASHSTLSVEEKEQNAINEDELFRLGNNALAKVTYNEEYEIHMEHQGYGALHYRKIKLDRLTSVIKIDDIYDGEGKASINFILAPSALIEIDNNIARINIAGVKVKLLTSYGHWNCDQSSFSKSYGRIEKVPRLRVVGDGEQFNCNIEIQIEP